jgi:hypothetical protein
VSEGTCCDPPATLLRRLYARFANKAGPEGWRLPDCIPLDYGTYSGGDPHPLVGDDETPTGGTGTVVGWRSLYPIDLPVNYDTGITRRVYLFFFCGGSGDPVWYFETGLGLIRTPPVPPSGATVSPIPAAAPDCNTPAFDFGRVVIQRADVVDGFPVGGVVGEADLTVSAEYCAGSPPVPPPPLDGQWCVSCIDFFASCVTVPGGATAGEAFAQFAAACDGRGGVRSIVAGCTDCAPTTAHCYACADDIHFGIIYVPGDGSDVSFCAPYGGVAHRWLLSDGDSPCGEFPIGCSCTGETTPENTGTGTYTGPYGVTTPNPLWDTAGPADWLGELSAGGGTYTWTYSLTTTTNAGFKGKIWADDSVRIFVDSETTPD